MADQQARPKALFPHLYYPAILCRVLWMRFPPLITLSRSGYLVLVLASFLFRGHRFPPLSYFLSGEGVELKHEKRQTSICKYSTDRSAPLLFRPDVAQAAPFGVVNVKQYRAPLFFPLLSLRSRIRIRIYKRSSFGDLCRGTRFGLLLF